MKNIRFLILILLCAIVQGMWANDVTLSGSDSYIVNDGDVLTGSTSGTVTIAAGAKITLNGVTINGGIVCEGSATITLVGTNSVTGLEEKAGIQVGGEGTTLTIKGYGSLTATGGDDAAGIGLSRAWNTSVTGGDIVIESGNITAKGAPLAAGIGTGVVLGYPDVKTASIGNITIKGGSVTATGGYNAAGIGTGHALDYGSPQIGMVTIYDDIYVVDASSISNFSSVEYMHVDGETVTNVTDDKTDYFTITEDGNRKIIVPKDIDYNITIAYVNEHGTVTGAETAKAGQTVTLTITPDDGYKLQTLTVKDRQNNDVTLSGTSFIMPKRNVTVTASWAPIDYSISYDLSGGTVATENPSTYNIESNDITLVNPTHAELEFTGWTGTGLDMSSMKVTIPTGSTGNRSYQATWKTEVTLSESNNYTVYNGNVLTGSTSGTVTIVDGARITLNGVTIDGGIVCEGMAEITLVGTNSVTGPDFKAGIQMGGEGTTLTIKGVGSLTAIGGTDADGIGTISGSAAPIGTLTIYDDISMIDASSITNFGSVVYMHGETNVTDNKIDYFTIIEDGNRKIIAPKDDTDYTITYDSEHGTVTGAATAKFGQTVTLTLTHDDGYELQALTVKDSQNNDVTLSGTSFIMPKSNVTVTASWAPIDYSISYDLAGGTVATENPSTYNIESDEITLVNPTYEGMVFEGWIGTGLDEPTMTVTIPTGSSGNRSYQATWNVEVTLSENNNYTVYNRDVLTGSTGGTVTIAAGSRITLKNATINGGIICEGSATITLVGTNSVTGLNEKAGIQVGGDGTTLTIKGGGSLTATGGFESAGIGLSLAVSDVTGGNIVIEGGNITATGGEYGAGLGTGVVFNATASLGSITIKGGSLTAESRYLGDGIGTGGVYNSTVQIGTLTIYDGIDLVDASSITDFGSVEYMHVDGRTVTNVTDNKTDYFTIVDYGNRKIIVPKDDTEYTITYDSEHGTVTGTETANVGQIVTLTITPDDGYSLQTLTVKNSQDNDVTLRGTSFVMPRSNVTVTASWTPIDYSINYDLSGGTVATENPSTYNVESDDITLVNPTHAEFEFIGWTGTGLDEPTMTVTIPTGSTGERNYQATWKAMLADGSAYTMTSDKGIYQATYTKTLGEERIGKHQAWLVPFDYTIKDADTDYFTFYKINMIANAPNPSTEASDEMWVFLKKLNAGDVLHGNMPYVYKPKQAVTDYEFTTLNTTLKAKNTGVIAKSETLEDIYSFYATYENTTATADDPFYYVNIKGEICLGDNGTLTVGPYRWIIRKTGKFGETPSYAREMHFFDGEETTGIASPKSSPEGKDFSPLLQEGTGEAWYSLDGRRLSGKPSEKGMYIVRGKKIVIK